MKLGLLLSPNNRQRPRGSGMEIRPRWVTQPILCIGYADQGLGVKAQLQEREGRRCRGCEWREGGCEMEIFLSVETILLSTWICQMCCGSSCRVLSLRVCMHAIGPPSCHSNAYLTKCAGSVLYMSLISASIWKKKNLGTALFHMKNSTVWMNLAYIASVSKKKSESTTGTMV